MLKEFKAEIFHYFGVCAEIMDGDDKNGVLKWRWVNLSI